MEKPHLEKPVALCKQALWTEEAKIKLYATIIKSVFGEKKQYLMKRTPCQLLSMGVDPLSLWVYVAACSRGRWKNEFH